MNTTAAPTTSSSTCPSGHAHGWSTPERLGGGLVYTCVWCHAVKSETL